MSSVDVLMGCGVLELMRLWCMGRVVESICSGWNAGVCVSTGTRDDVIDDVLNKHMEAETETVGRVNVRYI